MRACWRALSVHVGVVRRVVVVPRDDRREVELADQVDLPGGGAHEQLVGVERVAGTIEQARQPLFQLGNQLVARTPQRLVVPHACLSAGGDDDPLEPVGHHRADVVPEDVFGLGRNQFGRFEHLCGRGVLALERLTLLFGEFGEPLEEDVVQLRGSANSTGGCDGPVMMTGCR